MSARSKWFVAVALCVVAAIPVWALTRARASSSSHEGARTPPRPGVPTEALSPARTARDRIEDSERRMVEEDRALTQALDRMEAGRFVPAEQQATAGAFRTYVQSLRGIATDLISHHREFVSTEREYREALAAAPGQFREARRLRREYAADEPYAEIKRDYERLSEDWLTLASLVERQAAAVERDERTRD